MEILNFIPQTAGERLFKAIAQEVLGAGDYLAVKKARFLQIGGRSSDFSEYLIGIKTLNLLGRLVKKSQRVLEIDDATLHHGEMVNYLQTHLELASEGNDLLDKLARMSIDAAKNSGKPISNNTKRIVRNGLNEIPCYLCGTICRQNTTIDTERITYDHLWPASFGGDSIPENLLPACSICNNKKENMLLWHTGALFSFILKPSPSEDEVKSIRRREKIARQVQNILINANQNNFSLKNSAIDLGPANFQSIQFDDVEDAVDYFNFSFQRD